MTTDSASAVRLQSKRLFGNVDTVPVAVAIVEEPDGIVNATDLSWKLRIANNRVRAQLVKFAAAGLLHQTPGETGKKWYMIADRDHPFWAACIRLRDEWEA